MTPSLSLHSAWTCRWELIEGPRQGGQPRMSRVWICEYPYRTIRPGPSDDCEGCRRAVRLETARRQARMALARDPSVRILAAG